MIAFEIVQGAERGRIFEVDQPQILIGRTPNNHVIVSDYHVSSEHGQVFLENGQFVYRDLRSTNGSSVRRQEQVIPVDARCNYEITVRDGDHLVLGAANDAVVLKLSIARPTAQDDDGRVLAIRRIAQLSEVVGKIEKDPGVSAFLYRASKSLGRQFELGEALDAVVDVVFESLTRATHVAILLRNEVDHERFAVACARERADWEMNFSKLESIYQVLQQSKVGVQASS